MSSDRALLVLLFSAALCAGVGACGGDNRARHQSAAVSRAPFPGDQDGSDGRVRSAYLDSDDGGVRGFGQAAGAQDAREIAALVQSYYAAAASGDGAQACSRLYYLVAESLPEQYARPPGPRYLKGAASCPALLSRVFAHFHRELQSRPTVVSVRVDGDRAQALLGWRTLPAGSLEARREGRAWKLNAALAAPLP